MGMHHKASGGVQPARIRVAGPDHKGIIAAVTGYLSQSNLNIIDIDQRILDDYLVMNMVVDTRGLRGSLPAFLKGLQTVAGQIRMQISYTPPRPKGPKRIALLVTREPHCAEEILQRLRRGAIKAQAAVMIGNQADLRPLARRFHVPFVHFPSENKQWHEQQILNRLEREHVDLIVLARYMQILSPEFVFHHEGKIINIHPSLLPAFPGPRAYEQAFNKGVDYIGVTAHFVTAELDTGPIICQQAARINKSRATIPGLIRIGQQLERETLARAVTLFVNDRLVLRRGRVIDSRHEHEVQERAKEFYRPSS
ncbi:MAG TPA: formyltetrahydrofolate deformylase [Nitrospiria bacterium]|nr:formyltetrahydrofolate deformylase [Nitrospiria bacterium]